VIFTKFKDKYLEWLQVQNYSEATIYNYNFNLRLFFSWLGKEEINELNQVDRKALLNYQKYIYKYRKANGKPLSLEAQERRVGDVVTFFRWMVRQNHLLYNPARDLPLPYVPKRIPTNILTVEEVEKIMDVPNIKKPHHLRNRAIMETFYATGIRRLELINLKITDIDFERERIFIKAGKGDKDRLLPISPRALKWIDKYLEEVRPDYATEPDEGVLFISKTGKPLDDRTTAKRIRDYIKAAGINKPGSCHIFRSTMATLMLEHGADIRYVQEMLGHNTLEATKLYTRVSIAKLKEVHNRTHPAKLRKSTFDD